MNFSDESLVIRLVKLYSDDTNFHNDPQHEAINEVTLLHWRRSTAFYANFGENPDDCESERLAAIELAKSVFNRSEIMMLHPAVPDQ
ncbi:hypothetical protein [Bosea sp. UC22_33]|uniref:hypothetical protein n=1 Tax=Bosea sp. UC22_33 TaxID=3350165 RepID=UPI00366B0CF1